MFGALLCHTNQNIHYYDGDLQYDHLKLVQRIKVCGVVMHLVCRRFNQGEQAYTPKEIHDLTKIPQQIVNQSVKELLRARLLVEIRNGKKSSFEESVVLHPIEKIEHLTYGVMIERLFGYGEDISSLAALESDMAMWKDIDIVNAEFIEKRKQIAF